MADNSGPRAFGGTSQSTVKSQEGLFQPLISSRSSPWPLLWECLLDSPSLPIGTKVLRPGSFPEQTQSMNHPHCSSFIPITVIKYPHKKQLAWKRKRVYSAYDSRLQSTVMWATECSRWLPLPQPRAETSKLTQAAWWFGCYLASFSYLFYTV